MLIHRTQGRIPADMPDTVTGLFVPKTFRSQERNTNFGRFVPWKFRSLDDSYLGRFVPRTIRSLIYHGSQESFYK